MTAPHELSNLVQDGIYVALRDADESGEHIQHWMALTLDGRRAAATAAIEALREGAESQVTKVLEDSGYRVVSWAESPAEFDKSLVEQIISAILGPPPEKQ